MKQISRSDGVSLKYLECVVYHLGNELYHFPYFEQSLKKEEEEQVVHLKLKESSIFVMTGGGRHALTCCRRRKGDTNHRRETQKKTPHILISEMMSYSSRLFYV